MRLLRTSLLALLFASPLPAAFAGTNQEPANINGCIYSASTFTMANGQHASFGCDLNGNLKVVTSGGGAITAPLAPSGSVKTLDDNSAAALAALQAPLAPRSGVVTQSSVSVASASTALLTAGQFTNFEKICVALTASTGVWVNWANAAAVAAAPSEYIPPGQCDSWVGATGFMPNQAAFAISNSASTIAVTVEGN